MKFSALFRATLAVMSVTMGSAFAQPVDFVALTTLTEPMREQRLAQGASKEGEVTLYTSLTVEELQHLASAFEKKYGVKLRFWRAGSEKIVQRIATETRAGRFDFDVVETNGPELEALYREKLLVALSSPHDADLLPVAFRPHKAWVGTRLNMFVQAWNTRLVKTEDLPKSWADLLDPRWKSKLAIEADDVDWFGAVMKGLGEDKGLALFRDIMATNEISLRKGHSLLAGLVASGEVPFALTVYSHNVEKQKQKGAPIDWYVIPPAFVRSNGMGVSNKPVHPHAALLLYDFLLSPEGQRIIEEGHYIPVNRRLHHPEQELPLEVIDPAIVLDDGAKWEKSWQEIFVKRAK